MHDTGTRRDEHKTWNREHVHWLEDLTRWREERREALELVLDVERVLRFPDEHWNVHQEAMVALEQELARHQHHLDQGEDDVLERARHDASRAKHAHEKAAHTQLKARHESVMQHVRALHNLLARS